MFKNGILVLFIFTLFLMINEKNIFACGTVNPGSIETDQTICNGGDPANITNVTSANNYYSYRWEYTDSPFTAWSSITPLATNQNYNPPAGLTATRQYRRVAVGWYDAASNIVIVTVQSTVTAGSIGSAQTICNGGTPALLTSTTAGTGSGTITYQWQTNASGSYVDISGATAATYQPPALTTTTSYQRRTVSTQNGTPCYSAYTSAVTITVQSVVTSGVIASDQTICNGGTPALLTSTTAGTGSGSITYQWQTDASGSWVDISGETSATYQPPSLTTTTSYQRRTVSTQNGVPCNSAYTSPVTITVQSVVTSGVIGSNETICNGATPSLLSSTANGTGSGAITYQWQTNASGSYVDISGATAATYQPPALTTTTSYQRRTVSTQNSVPCYSGYTTPVTITVQSAVAEGAIGSDETICNGNTPSQLTSTTDGAGSGTITYEWQTDASGSWVDISGETSATYQPPSLTSTTSYQRRTVSTQDGTPCYSAYTAVVTITVQSVVTEGAIGSDESICTGGTPALITSTGDGTGDGTIQYQWQTNASGSYANIGGQTLATYQPPALTATTSYRRRTRSRLNGKNCWSVYTTPVTITVEALPVAPSITRNPDVAIVCASQTLTVTSSAGSGGAGTIADDYRYSTDNGSIWSGWSTSLPSFAAVTGTNLIESRRTADGSGCTTSGSNQVSWTVVDLPVAPGLTKNPDVAFVCDGENLTVSFTAGSGGAGTIVDEYRFSTDNGFIWSGWSTTVPSFVAVTGTNLIESRRTADGTGCTTSSSNQVFWDVYTIDASLSSITSDGECPQLIPSQGFDPNNDGPYDAGATKLIFQVDRINSSAAWRFTYAITEVNGLPEFNVEDVTATGTGYSSSLSSSTGTFSAIPSSAGTITVAVLLTNTPGDEQDIKFEISNVTETEHSCSVDYSTNNSVINIAAMPAVGPFD